MQTLLPDLAPPCWITLTYSLAFPAWVASFENARGFANCCIAPYWFTTKSTKTSDSSKSFTSAMGRETQPQICPSREWHIHCFICVLPAFVWAVERPAGQARDPLTRPIFVGGAYIALYVCAAPLPGRWSARRCGDMGKQCRRHPLPYGDLAQRKPMVGERVAAWSRLRAVAVTCSLSDL